MPWSKPCVFEVLQVRGVARITADQCQLGQEAEGGEPVRTPTGFMSNCEDILEQLNHRCKSMRNNEQFYTEGCGIMIDGDDDARLHYRDDCNDLQDPDISGYGQADVHFMTSGELASASERLKVSRHE